MSRRWGDQTKRPAAGIQRADLNIPKLGFEFGEFRDMLRALCLKISKHKFRRRVGS
jgi:hypothetical protein